MCANYKAEKEVILSFCQQEKTFVCYIVEAYDTLTGLFEALVLNNSMFIIATTDPAKKMED